jgi:DNA-binding LacI/PurR family transcriptional regulator
MAAFSEKTITLCQHYIEEKVLGVFWAPSELSETMDDTNHRIAEMLDRAGIAVVLLDRDYEKYPRRSRFDLIGIDNIRAGYTQANHLLSHGIQRIVYFARKCSASTVTQRIIGFHAAKRDHGIAQEDWDALLGDPQDSQTVQDLLALTPEAVVCANDLTAALLMRSLLDHGVVIPRDIRIVGIDDVKYSNLLTVSLTTVHQPCVEIGAAAVVAMARCIDHRNAPSQEVNLDCSLIIRESCGTRTGQM